MTKQQIALKSYQLKIDELNTFKEEITTKSDDEALELFLDFLIATYTFGYGVTNFYLDKDTKLVGLEDVVDKEYDGVSIKDKFKKYFSQQNDEELKRLIDSEWHRAYSSGSYRSAIESGSNVKKVWRTMEDEKVRDAHFPLDGVEVDLNDYFYTIDGDYALYPSNFTKAENNANCRCWIDYVSE